MSELIAGAVVGESWPGSTGLLDAPAEPLELELAEVPEPTLADLVQWHRASGQVGQVGGEDSDAGDGVPRLEGSVRRLDGRH